MCRSIFKITGLIIIVAITGRDHHRHGQPHGLGRTARAGGGSAARPSPASDPRLVGGVMTTAFETGKTDFNQAYDARERL